MNRPKPKEQMWNAMQAPWESIQMKMLHKVVASIPQCIQVVIDSSGGSTR